MEVRLWKLRSLTSVFYHYSLTLTLKQSIPTVGRQAAEQWFATLPDSSINHLSLQGQTSASDDIYYASYLQVVDLYASRVLPECGDLESARSFVEYNSFLSDEKKEVGNDCPVALALNRTS